MNNISDEEITTYEQLQIEYDTIYSIKDAFIKAYGQTDDDVAFLTELYVEQMAAYNRLKTFKKSLFDKYIGEDLVYVDNNCFVDTINKRIIYRKERGVTIHEKAAH